MSYLIVDAKLLSAVYGSNSKVAYTARKSIDKNTISGYVSCVCEHGFMKGSIQPVFKKEIYALAILLRELGKHEDYECIKGFYAKDLSIKLSNENVVMQPNTYLVGFNISVTIPAHKGLVDIIVHQAVERL